MKLALIGASGYLIYSKLVPFILFPFLEYKFCLTRHFPLLIYNLSGRLHHTFLIVTYSLNFD